MKTYIVYLNGEEIGFVKATSHNQAEIKAKQRVQSARPNDKDADISVAYTEI